MKYGELTIQVSEQAYTRLQELTATGLFGDDPQKTAARLVLEGIRREFAAGLLHNPLTVFETEPPVKKCAACGSTKIQEPLTMSGNDLECADCGTAYQ